MVQDGRIDMGHARALLSLSKARQVEIAQQVADKGLSVRETERLVQESTTAPKAVRAAATGLDPDSRRLQEELCETLGATVHLKTRSGGKGSVVIDYSSLDELQGLLKRLKRP
jgi:ParB family chromosome partitioning protein